MFLWAVLGRFCVQRYELQLLECECREQVAAMLKILQKHKPCRLAKNNKIKRCW